MKIIYIIIGLVSLVVGFIGIFIPMILPTAPFLLLSSYCFAKGSSRFHRWFTETAIYKNYLEDFEKNKSMTLRTKIFLLSFSSTMIAFPILKVKSIHLKIFLILIVLCKYYYFIFKIKTVKKKEK